jgi:hypothetical protein
VRTMRPELSKDLPIKDFIFTGLKPSCSNFAVKTT